jgi:hypothetical protein
MTTVRMTDNRKGAAMRTIVTLLLALLGAVAAARADYQIGVVNFTASGPVAVYGSGLSDMLVTDLVQLAGQGSKFAACGVKIVELKRRGEIIAEIELQQGGNTDPGTQVKTGQLLDATYVIEGSVQPAGADGIAWTLQMREVANGRIVARDNGSGKIERLSDESTHIAELLLGQICGKSYKLSGNAGPMTLTGTACSLLKPFSMKGAGGGMEVTFSFNPTDETSGTMSYSGGGTGGVRMAGQGSYTITLTDKGGTLVHKSSGQVERGGGATHTTTTTLTRTGPC